ncbi:MAG: hypothetical protein H7Z75_15555 [Ferruginibacter sp.]|nr:hypothetical protein [Cytophagales bacterium]
MILVEGRRDDWVPVPVSVEVSECTFLDGFPFAGVERKLANAFMVRNIPYHWQSGVREKLPSLPTDEPE